MKKLYAICVFCLLVCVVTGAYLNYNKYQKEFNNAFSKFKIKGEIMKHNKILYCKNDIILRGVDDIPSSLFATPDFDPILLPPNLRNNIEYLQSISFKHGFGTGRVFNDGEYSLPNWLSKQKKLKLVDLRFFTLKDLGAIKALPLEFLLLSNVSIIDREQVIKDIERMHQLKYLIQDNVFTSGEIDAMNKVFPTLQYITIKDYTKMIVEKKIDFDRP